MRLFSSFLGDFTPTSRSLLFLFKIILYYGPFRQEGDELNGSDLRTFLDDRLHFIALRQALCHCNFKPRLTLWLQHFNDPRSHFLRLNLLYLYKSFTGNTVAHNQLVTRFGSHYSADMSSVFTANNHFCFPELFRFNKITLHRLPSST
ncbi:hypothetical protein D3C78_1469150 [compost metagenome]